MPPVLIPCPHADWLVPTGQIAESLDEIDEPKVLRRCQECGREHEWTRDDAVIVGRML